MSTEINPYASPTPEVGNGLYPPPPSVPPTASFHPPLKRLVFVFGLKCLAILGGLAMIGAVTGTVRLLERVQRGEFITPAEVHAGDAFLFTIKPLNIGANFAASIAFLLWLYPTARNLPALGTPTPKFSPGFAVGSFFIPVLALYLPYQALAEIWRGSDPARLPHAPRSHARPQSVALLGFWWGLHLCGMLASYLLIMTAVNQQTVEGQITSNMGVIGVILLIEIPRDILTLLMMYRIFCNQQDRHAHLHDAAAEPVVIAT